MVIAIRNIEDVFKTNTLRVQDVSLFQKLCLKNAETGYIYRISDLYYHNQTVYILSVSSVEAAGKKTHDGMLWAFGGGADGTRQLTGIRRFPGMRPEGICYNGDARVFCITFDNGSDHASQMMTMKVPS
jgi:hypothetical protein